MTASSRMAKPKPTLEYPATTAYKQWVWAEIRRRKKTLQWLVDEMKKRARAELLEIGKFETISNATLSMLLGPEDVVPPPSNSALLPAINKALGIAPPPVCDPASDLAQVRDLFTARWNAASPAVKRAILELLGDDTTGLDGNSEGVSGVPKRR